MSEGKVSTADARSDSVVVIIVSFRGLTDVVNCLASLQCSSLPTFEVVVVENGGPGAFSRLRSELATRYAAQSNTGVSTGSVVDPNAVGSEAHLRWARLLLPDGQPVCLIDAGDNLGYGGAINLALQCIDKSRGWRGVWILNPDTQPAPSAMEMVVNHAEQEGCGLVGSRLVDSVHKTIQMRGGARLLPLIGRSTSFGYGEPANSSANTAEIERRLGWISGAASYATRDFIEAVGPMNDRYFLYCEDVDWSLRRGAFRLGYAHDSVVLHIGGTTTGQVSGSPSDLTIYLSERNMLLLTREHFPLIYPLTAMMACLSLVKYLLRGNSHAFVVGWRGWLAGLRGETGRPDRLRI